MPSTILCPTRGGTASYPNQDWAIALAKERGSDLLFLYVNDVEFLGHTASPKVIDIESELDEMGVFLLTMAQERAKLAGVEAFITVRRGVFQDVLKDMLDEHPITTIVMGSSTQSTGVITLDYVKELADEIHSKTGVEFIILYEGEVVGTYKAP